MIRRPPRSTLFPYNDALPIFLDPERGGDGEEQDLGLQRADPFPGRPIGVLLTPTSEEHTSEIQPRQYLACRLLLEKKTVTLCCYKKHSSSASPHPPAGISSIS